MMYPKCKFRTKLLYASVCCIVTAILLFLKLTNSPLSHSGSNDIAGFVSVSPEKFSNWYMLKSVNMSKDKYITKHTSHFQAVNHKEKKILLWTPLFGSWKQNWLEKAEKELETCPSQCTATIDKAELTVSDAVLFHATDLWADKGKLIDPPKERLENQVWVILSMEPVPGMRGSFKPIVFNWTMHYRRESTVHLPYGRYRAKTDDDVKHAEPIASRNIFKEKNKFAATLVSNCNDQANRAKIIQGLQQYIDLDYFGRCSGRQLCPPATQMDAYECGKKYLGGYKFYVALENSYCRDYLTEKVWYALERDQIPIVAVDSYTETLLPPGSFLNVFRFADIKSLADRMMEIGNNETLYNSFFEWQRHYTIEQFLPYFCMLCLQLFDSTPPQSYPDLDSWIDDDICSRKI